MQVGERGGGGDIRITNRRRERFAARVLRIVRWVPVPLIIGGALFYWFTPEGYTSLPFFEAAPLIVAPVYSLRATIAVGVLALTVQVLLEIANGTAAEPSSIVEMFTELLVVCMAVIMNRLIAWHNRRLATARGVAEAAQRAVLPYPPETLSGLQVAARYVPADADALIGGDMYVAQETPYGVRVIVGDVRGKGLGAVHAVALSVGIFREAAEDEPDLGSLAARLDRAVRRGAQRRQGLAPLEGFITAVLAEFDTEAGVVRVLSRGHPAPLMLYGDGQVRPVAPAEASLPLGMGDLGDWPDEIAEVEFPPGASLLFFTDGVTEARDAAGVFYDPEAGLCDQVFGAPAELLAAVEAGVSAHTGGSRQDDMALLALTRPGLAHVRQTPYRPPPGPNPVSG